MFFVLSKLLYFFITPFCWILILLLAALIFPKKRKYFLFASLIFLLVFTNPWLYRRAMLSYEEKPLNPAFTQLPETAILLTGIVGFDSMGHGHFGKSADRFIQSAHLLHSKQIKRLIISGGSGNFWRKEKTESLFLRQQFLLQGIPDSALLAETLSRNTFENAIHTRHLLDSLQLKGPFLLITSALHMPRAKKVFTKAGISFIPYPCDYKVYPQAPDFKNTVYPDITYLREWENIIKEWVGTIVYGLTGKA